MNYNPYYADLARTILALLGFGSKVNREGQFILRGDLEPDISRQLQSMLLALNEKSDLVRLVRTAKEFASRHRVSPANFDYLVEFAAARAQLTEQEVIEVLNRLGIQYSIPWQSVQEDSYVIDGNTVRRLGGSSVRARHLAKELSVDVWLGGETSLDESSELRAALVEFLKEIDFSLSSESPPEFGSLFQSFRFIGKIGNYSKSLIANLKTAFGATAQSQKVANLVQLSTILEKHAHIVLRFDTVIAVKTTRNGQSYVTIAEITPHMDREIHADPTLLRDAEAMYSLLTDVRPQSSSRVIGAPPE